MSDRPGHRHRHGRPSRALAETPHQQQPSRNPEQAWLDKLAALDAFRAREGHCDVDRWHEEGDHKLGVWLHNCRNVHAAGKLPEQRVRDLESRGVTWHPYEKAWDRNLAALERFRHAHGHLNVPRDYRDGNLRLGTIAHNYDMRQRRGDLPMNRVRILAALGFPFGPRRARRQTGGSLKRRAAS